jgi:Flp pilus assembly protein TadG
MKLRFIKFERQGRSSEGGNFLIIVAAVFFAFLAIAGWATDAANLYRVKLTLQRAVDAGVMAGTTQLSQGMPAEDAKNLAVSIGNANLIQAGLKAQGGEVHSLSWDSQNISLKGSANVPLLFLRMIPWMGSTELVSSTAIASTSQSSAIVSLVLDTSYSMSCPTIGSCIPNPCSAQGACPAGVQSKLKRLREAAVSFVNKFNESQDHVALISFSGKATVNKNMLDPFDKAALMNIINHDLVAAGGTNIEDGILAGKDQIATLKDLKGARRFLVVISDGAPNASNHGSPEYPNPCKHNEAVASDKAKQAYLRAIQIADDARSEGSTFYTVGLGDAPANPLPTDPYEWITDDNSVKPRLLKRLTNDAGAKNDPSFDCVQDYTHYNDGTPNRLAGQYINSPSVDELQGVLDGIAKSILVKAHLTK